jgi:TonB family protein
MGAEMPVALDAWTTLGRVLDTERDRIFGAFASKGLSNVGPASARGSARPGWQREQDFPKQMESNVTPGCYNLMMRHLLLALIVTLASLSSLHAQSASPVRQPPPPRAIYTPKPAYRAEWAKQGLTGKGVVLVNIDKQTGNVTGARMLTSTGNKLLDGAALEAYSQWRFQPGTVSQVKIPIEFANRAKPPTAKRTLSQLAILYPLLILLGFAVAVIAMRTRRRHIR